MLLQSITIAAIMMFLPLTVNAKGGSLNSFTLPNGLTIIHKQTSDHPLVTVQLFLRGSSLLEQPSQAGLANFTQTLMFQGTKSRDAEKLSQEIEDIGASITSDVEHDYCSLGLSLMNTSFPKAMEILSDIIINPAFSENEIEKERANILAGLRSRKDHLSQVASDRFYEVFYGTHPYAWPEAGKPGTITKTTRADIVAWHRDHYTAKNMLMAVIGNVPEDAVRKEAVKYFSAITAGEAFTRYPDPASPKAEKVVKTSVKFQQAYVIMGLPAPAIGGRDFTTLKIINALLGSRMTGRLFTELREKLSLAYDVNSSFPTQRKASRFTIYLGLEKRNVELAKKRINEILTDLTVTPVPQKELEDTRNFIRGVYLLDHQPIHRQAWYLGWWEVMGKGYAYDQQYLEQLMAVTPEDIQNAAKQLFTGNYTTVEIVPEK